MSVTEQVKDLSDAVFKYHCMFQMIQTKQQKTYPSERLSHRLTMLLLQLRITLPYEHETPSHSAGFAYHSGFDWRCAGGEQ